MLRIKFAPAQSDQNESMARAEHEALAFSIVS